uniref:Uncharacterized protein n=1 Tax=Physcomitrium patens TaxID=3218 RepID=A0A7I4AAB6_PHYPA
MFTRLSECTKGMCMPRTNSVDRCYKCFSYLG